MLTVSFKKKAIAVATLIEASAVFSAARDKSGQGGRTWRDGVVTDEAGKTVARISYNGRVYQNDKLVYCPHSASQDEGRPEIFNEGRESVWGAKKPNPYAVGTVEQRVFALAVEYANSCYVRAA